MARIDRAVLDLLKTYFVSRRGTSHVAGDVLPGGTDTYKLGAPTNRWDTIYARQVIADSLTGGGGSSNADTVDGFHASSTPTASTILPLDAASKFPTLSYPDAILRDGSRTLTGNLDTSPGVTFDGVDVSEHVIDDTHHQSGMGSDDHPQYMHITSQRTVTAVHTYNPGVLTPFVTLGINAQDQLVSGLYADRAVDLDRSVIAESGLTGGGQLSGGDVFLYVGGGSNISVDADAVNLDTPGSIDIDSVNQVSTAHTHEVTASFNPGIAEAILQSGPAGQLLLGGDFSVDGDTIYVDVSEDGVYINAGVLPARRGALTVHPSNTGQRGLVLEQLSGQLSPLMQVYDSSGNDLIVLTSEGDLESGQPNFVSGLTGWQITSTGNAEFWNATIRGELHASVFVADEIHASGGTLAVMTAAIVVDPGSSGDNVMGSTGSAFDLRVQASYDTGLSYFSDNDVIRFKFMGDDGGGLDIWDVYVEIDGTPGSVQNRDMSNGAPGYFIYNVRRRSGGATGLEIPVGVSGVHWGDVSGAGYSGGVLLTSDLNTAPYIDVFTIDNNTTYNPWEAQAVHPRVRMGNLDGVALQAEQWGIAFGSDLSDDTQPYGIFSDLQASLHGIKQIWWDQDGNQVGAVDPNAILTEPIFWLGQSSVDRTLEFTKDGVLKLSGSVALGYGFSTIAIGSIFAAEFNGDASTHAWRGNEYDYITGKFPYGSYYDTISASPAGLEDYIDTAWVNGGAVFSGVAHNWCINGSFQHPTPLYLWDALTGNGSAVKHTDSLYGTDSLRITAGSTETYTGQAFTVNNGSTISVSVWVKTDNIGNADARLRLRNVTDGSNADTTNKQSWGVADGWYMLEARWTNSTGVAKTINVRLSNYTNNSSTNIWFDGVMVVIGAAATSKPEPFIFGEMPMSNFSGNDFESTTIRVDNDWLEYDGVIIPTAEWTVNFWYRPSSPESYYTVDSTLFYWGQPGQNEQILIKVDSGSNNIQLYVDDNGSSQTSSGVNLSGVGVWDMWTVTYDGTYVRFYQNGILIDTLTNTLGWTITPDRLAFGCDIEGYDTSKHTPGWFRDAIITNQTADILTIQNWYSLGFGQAVRGISQFEMYISNPADGSVSLRPEGIYVKEKSGHGVFAASTVDEGMRWGGQGALTLESGDVFLGDPLNAGLLVSGDWLSPEIGFFLGDYSVSSPIFGMTSLGTIYGPGFKALSTLDSADSWYGERFRLGGTTSAKMAIGPGGLTLSTWMAGGSGEWNAGIYMENAGAGLGMFNRLWIDVADRDNYVGEINISARTKMLGYNTDIEFWHASEWSSGVRVGQIGIDEATWLRINNDTAKNIYTPRTFAAAGGIIAGTSALPGGGGLGYTGSMRPYKNATFYTAYTFVPMTTPGTHTSWDGDVKVDVSTPTYFNTTPLNVPLGAKAVLLNLIGKDSASHGTTGGYVAFGPSATYWWATVVRPHGGGIEAECNSPTPTDGNSGLYFQINALSTLNVWVRIWGYWI